MDFSTMRRVVDWALVSAGVCLGLAAMAVDHLLGDDPGLEDPPTFLISAAIILVIAARTSLSLHDRREDGRMIHRHLLAAREGVWHDLVALVERRKLVDVELLQLSGPAIPDDPP